MSATLTMSLGLQATRGGESDEVLLARCRAGERVAFDILLHRYRERVLNLAFQLLRDRHAAEDVAQDVFVRAFSRIHEFRGEAALFTWFYQITLNECRARMRRAKPVLELADEQLQNNVLHTPEGAVLQKIALEQILDQLSEPLRIALILREWHGLSYEEIAGVLKLPVGTVRSRLHEARRKFQERWDAQ